MIAIYSYFSSHGLQNNNIILLSLYWITIIKMLGVLHGVLGHARVEYKPDDYDYYYKKYNYITTTCLIVYTYNT